MVVILSVIDTMFGPRSSKLSLMGEASLMARSYLTEMARGEAWRMDSYGFRITAMWVMLVWMVRVDFRGT